MRGICRILHRTTTLRYTSNVCFVIVICCRLFGCSVARSVVVRHTLGEVVKPFRVCLWLPGTTLKQLSSQLLQLLFDIEGLAEKCKKYYFGHQLLCTEIQVICDPFISYRFQRKIRLQWNHKFTQGLCAQDILEMQYSSINFRSLFKTCS